VGLRQAARECVRTRQPAREGGQKTWER
jgi:hypothetical protein